MQTKCDNCGRMFERRPSHIYSHKFCSRACAYEYKRRQGIQKAKKCEYCGNPVRKGRRFCSQSCNFRFMWETKWAGKRTGKYEPSKRRFVTIMLRVPRVSITDVELELRSMIKRQNPMAGRIVMNILGERRLKSRES